MSACGCSASPTAAGSSESSEESEGEDSETGEDPPLPEQGEAVVIMLGGGSVIASNFDQTDTVEIVSSLQDVASVDSVVVSPLGHAAALVRYSQSQAEFFVDLARLDEPDSTTRLSEHVHEVGEVKFNPDGKFFSYVLESNLGSTVRVADITTGEMVDMVIRIRDWQWVGDDGRFAYMLATGENWLGDEYFDLHLSDYVAGTSEQVTSTDAGASDVTPDWTISPDGERWIYKEEEEEGSTWYVGTPQVGGSVPQPLAQLPSGLGLAGAAWTPDHEFVLLDFGDLYLYELATDTLEAVPPGPDISSGPLTIPSVKQAQMSPSGTHYAFYRSGSDTVSIATLPIQLGAAPSVIGDSSRQEQPRWSPDGTKLAWVGYDPDTGEEVGVLVANPDGSEPVDVSLEHCLEDQCVVDREWFTWMPNSRQIIYKIWESDLNHLILGGIEDNGATPPRVMLLSADSLPNNLEPRPFESVDGTMIVYGCHLARGDGSETMNFEDLDAGCESLVPVPKRAD